MADDISKKIIIQIEAQTDELKQSVADLNQTLDGLQQKQKQLADAGKENTNTFQELGTQVKATQTALESQSKAIEAHTKTLDTLNKSLGQSKDLLVSVSQQHENLSKSQTNHAENTKSLNSQIGALSATIDDQGQKLTKSKEAFDVHKATIKTLSSSFDQLKGVSGSFGPSLEEAAKGFEALKSGLSIVETGFTSVGAAIKTTGFGLLVLVLQSVVDYFTKTTEGSKKLKGAISAVGVIVEKVTRVFSSLGKFIVDAVSHPVQSLKALGNLIKENIINRFKAFSVILDGIIHLDFKKVANGAIQAFTGVTDATDKIGKAFDTVKKGVQDTTGEMVSAYENGYKEAGKNVDDHEAKVNASIDRQIDRYNKLKKNAQETYAEQDNGDQPGNNERRTEPIATKSPVLTVNQSESSFTTIDPKATIGTTLPEVKENENNIVEIKKSALQQVEAYAKKSAGAIATDALNVLTSSIKQQSEAKIAGLEKDKAAELSNSSLTSAQKLAVEQKYKQQEAQVKAKAFKEDQEAAIAQAIINGAIAVTKAEGQTGVLGALVIPGIIAETAVQVAKIAAQKPPAYAQGGLHYQSDGRGGTLAGYSRTDNTNAYLRSGEGIVVSEAMQVPWARNLVSAINVGFGGRDFSITNPGRGYAVGGIFTDGGDANRYYNQPVTDQKNLANTIAYQMINNFPPVYVDVKDINNQQNILAQTINRVNL